MSLDSQSGPCERDEPDSESETVNEREEFKNEVQQEANADYE